MSNSQPSDLASLALRLTQVVPEEIVLAVASALGSSGLVVSPSLCAQIVANVPQPTYRAAVDRFMAGWIRFDPSAPPVAVMYALRTAARAVRDQRTESSIEIVWTGPNPAAVPFRRTDQALLEVIEAARRTLTIVTFAAYKVPAIANALMRAAQRGVQIRLVIESAQASEGKLAYEAIDGIGSAVAAMATVYIWPREKRPIDQQGKYGSLHAKCAVADDDILFVSSANLTAYALTLNLELGLLVRGGPIPRRVAHHLSALIDHGVLVCARQ